MKHIIREALLVGFSAMAFGLSLIGFNADTAGVLLFSIGVISNAIAVLGVFALGVASLVEG